MPIARYYQEMKEEWRWRTEFDGAVRHFVIRDREAADDSDILLRLNTEASTSAAWLARMNKVAMMAVAAPYMFTLLDAILEYVNRAEMFDGKENVLPPELVQAISDEMYYAEHRFVRPLFDDQAGGSPPVSEQDVQHGREELRRNPLLTNRSRVALWHLCDGDTLKQRNLIESLILNHFTATYNNDTRTVLQKAARIEQALLSVPMLAWLGYAGEHFNHMGLVYEMGEIIGWIRSVMHDYSIEELPPDET